MGSWKKPPFHVSTATEKSWLQVGKESSVKTDAVSSNSILQCENNRAVGDVCIASFKNTAILIKASCP